MNAAKHWALWEANCASLQPQQELTEHFNDPHFALGFASLQAHYFAHNCFLQPEQILTNTNKIRHLPLYIVHGRYDIVCPLKSAWQLHQACPASELVIVREAGHNIKEPSMIDALIKVTKQVILQENEAC